MASKSTPKPKPEFAEHVQLIDGKIVALRGAADKARDNGRSLELVESVTNSLYDELDKLSKKSPSHQLSDLALSQVNRALKDVKELLKGDRYVDEITEFVPAGDNPEHRDAVLILGQAKAGIKRGKPSLEKREKAIRDLIPEARTLRSVLEAYADGQDPQESLNALYRDGRRWLDVEGYFIQEDLAGRIKERFTLE